MRRPIMSVRTMSRATVAALSASMPAAANSAAAKEVSASTLKCASVVTRSATPALLPSEAGVERPQPLPRPRAPAARNGSGSTHR